MNRYLILVFLFFLSTQTSYLQNTFLKTYDFGTTENSYQIISYKGRIFISTATYCGIECSFLTEIDTFGTILWRTSIPDIDISSGSVVIVNDTITVSGNNDPMNTFFRFAHFTLDGEKMGPTYTIKHPTREFTKMFQLTSQFYNNKYIVCGTGEQGDTSLSLIYVVNANGILDTLITLEPSNYQSIIWDSYIDREDKLTTYHQVTIGNPDYNYRKIIKFNTDFEIAWTYTSENDNDNSVIPKGCELLDGRMILSFINPQGIHDIHSVRAINIDGTIDWQHNYQVSGSKNRYILRLKTLSNGDIMGCGSYSEIAQNPRIDESIWLFRMSSEGDLIWERTYFDIDSTTGRSRHGALFDFIELQNGDIMAVGYLRYENGDMLVTKLDSNGCLNPQECETENMLTSNKEISIPTNEPILFTNLVQNNLEVNFTHIYNNPIFIIYDMSGRQLMTGLLDQGPNEIDITYFNPGIYFINFYSNGTLFNSSKFFKASPK